MRWHRRSRREGFTLVELLIVLAIIGLVLSVAVPELMTALMNANETVVIREMKTIHEAQVQYWSLFGQYAGTLAELGPPQTGATGVQGAKLIPASLASGEKNRYVFILTKTPGGFMVNANPKVFGRDGDRTFYIVQDGVVHQNRGAAPADANSPEIQ